MAAGAGAVQLGFGYGLGIIAWLPAAEGGRRRCQRGLTSGQLGVWQITSGGDQFWFRNIYWPGAALSLGSALVIGALAAWPTARRADNRFGTAISGAVGPLLVAAAYFLAAPRLVGIRAEQLSAHLLAPYAMIAGLAGSVLVTAIAQRAETTPQPNQAGSQRGSSADRTRASQ